MAKKKKNQEPDHDEDGSQNSFLTLTLYWIAGIFSFIGLIILIVFLYNLSSAYTIKGDTPILLDKTAQVGDFIGGLVGSIWAFAGVILFFIALTLQRKEFKAQRKELRLQRKEFKTQRKEFKVNRITSILYKQLSIIEEKAEKLKFLNGNINTSGFQSILDFTTYSSIFLSKIENPKKLTSAESKQFLEFLSFINSNELTNYERTLKISLEILLDLLKFDEDKNNNIDEEDIRQLSIMIDKNFELFMNKVFLNMYNKMLNFHIAMLEGAHEKSLLIQSTFKRKLKANLTTISLMEEIKNKCD